MKKVVLIRTDKIGDLVSTLPCDELLPIDYEAVWILRSGMKWIADIATPMRSSFEVDMQNRVRSFWSLLKYLRMLSPECSLHFVGPWWVALACWFAGIPCRGGRKSQWFTFLFFNRGLRQSRRASNKHEAEYNQEIVEQFFKLEHKIVPPLQLSPPRNGRLLEQNGLSAKNYTVIHPGMAGSALNWPTEFYVRLIEKLLLHTTVVLTGTAGDKDIVENIKLLFGQSPRFVDLSEKLAPIEWATILQSANGVIGPSTGVVHVAASVGAKVLGFYSPVKVQKSERWGPRGLFVKTLTPDVSCPGLSNCLGTNCEHYSCMKMITPEAVHAQLKKWIFSSK